MLRKFDGFYKPLHVAIGIRAYYYPGSSQVTRDLHNGAVAEDAPGPRLSDRPDEGMFVFVLRIGGVPRLVRVVDGLQ